VQKTTIYFPDELKRRVELEARARGWSAAEVIRAAVDRYTSRPRPKLPLFESLGHPIADRVDEVLAEGFGRD
jgi:hypothetical protein